MADSMSSIIAGVIQQMGDILLLKHALIFFFPYVHIYDNYRVVNLPLHSPLTWLCSLVFVDFMYYWFHRMAHEVNWMWASHIVHHSSEHYNLSTALRQSILQPWMSTLFYLPLPFFIPPPIFAVHKQWNTLYQFWIHTTTIRRMGWLEWFMNTPSHHRVHHDRRVHANYGGTFIIWDRIFGTFQDEGEGFDPIKNRYDPIGYINPERRIMNESSSNNGYQNGSNNGYHLTSSSSSSEYEITSSENEDEEGYKGENVVYGSLQSLHTWNPLVIQTHHVYHILCRVYKSGIFNMKDSFKTLWFGPGFRPKLRRSDVPPVDEERVRRVRRRSPITPCQTFYHFVHTILGLTQAVIIIVFNSKMSMPSLITLCLFTLTTFTIQGCIFDGNKAARDCEKFRLFAFSFFGIFSWIFLSPHHTLVNLPFGLNGYMPMVWDWIDTNSSIANFLSLFYMVYGISHLVSFAWISLVDNNLLDCEALKTISRKDQKKKLS